MSKLYAIIDQIIETLRNEDSLESIRDYKRMNGFTISRVPTISVGSEKISYYEESKDMDRAEAALKIHVFFDDRDLERGEEKVWEYAFLVRLSLLSNRLLGGLVDDMIVNSIQSIYADVNNYNIHACVLDVTAVYYEQRAKEVVYPKLETLEFNVSPI